MRMRLWRTMKIFLIGKLLDDNVLTSEPRTVDDIIEGMKHSDAENSDDEDNSEPEPRSSFHDALDLISRLSTNLSSLPNVMTTCNKLYVIENVIWMSKNVFRQNTRDLYLYKKYARYTFFLFCPNFCVHRYNAFPAILRFFLGPLKRVITKFYCILNIGTYDS